MDAWGLTDTGNVRKQNQDYYDIIEFGQGCLLAIVCDGMGGAKSGNIASRLAADVFCGEIRRNIRSDLLVDDVKRIMSDAVQLANQAVFEHAQLSDDFSGMGTTLVAAFVCGKTVIVANVGDSRAYLVESGGIRQITLDHSVVRLMLRRGEISREEARIHPGKNLITRAVGTEQRVVCDIFTLPVEHGDYVLLCSDGLSNLVTDQELLFEVVHGADKSGCCQRLLDMAKHRGAPDNVTCVLAAI